MESHPRRKQQHQKHQATTNTKANCIRVSILIARHIERVMWCVDREI